MESRQPGVRVEATRVWGDLGTAVGLILVGAGRYRHPMTKGHDKSDRDFTDTLPYPRAVRGTPFRNA